MISLEIWPTLLARMWVLGACALGAIVSAVLLVRRRSAPAGLGLFGFGLLFGAHLVSWLMNVLPIWMATEGAYALGSMFQVLSILVSLSTAAGVLCLTLALWAALSRNAVH